jgi:hypothetical protein
MVSGNATEIKIEKPAKTDLYATVIKLSFQTVVAQTD